MIGYADSECPFHCVVGYEELPKERAWSENLMIPSEFLFFTSPANQNMIRGPCFQMPIESCSINRML